MNINFSFLSNANYLNRGILPSFAIHQNMTQAIAIPVFNHLRHTRAATNLADPIKFKNNYREDVSLPSHENTIISDKENQSFEFKEIKFNIQKKRIMFNGQIQEGEFEEGFLRIGRVTFPSGLIQEGEYKDCKLNGRGKLTFPAGGAEEGEYMDGALNGRGRKIFKDGEIYVGGFKDGKFNGQGKLTFPAGGAEEGQFVNGLLNGRGRKTFKDGGFYEGEFKNGLPSGQGRGSIIFEDGKIYVGEFKDGRFNGQGRVTFPCGQIQEGQFEDGRLHGQARVVFENGDIFEGEFKDNQLNGQGKRTYSIGAIHEGQFKDDLLHGQGKKVFPNGEIQEGEFKNDQLNGQGKVSQGKIIIQGEFKDGQLNGQGKKSFSTREIQEGEFQNGQFHKSLYPQIKISKKRLQHIDIKPPYISNHVFEDLLNDLEPTSTDITEIYIKGMRRLFFGLSIGQKKRIKKLSKQSGIDLKIIKELEGSKSCLNFLYVFLHLERLIVNLKAEINPNIDFLTHLQMLHDDLQRSLPFAFIAHMDLKDSKEEEILVQMVKDISQKLNQMKPNARILLPIGTIEHATLLVFEKMEDGAISATHYNTGFGVGQHLTKKMNKKGIRDHLNVLLSHFPIQKKYPPIQLGVHQANFECMLIDVFKLINDRSHRERHNIKQINPILKKCFGKGLAGPSKPVQINGVCASQVLTAAIKDILGSKINYNTYKLHLLTHMQAELQEITDGMVPLLGEIKEMSEYYPLHQLLLKENKMQIEATKQLLEQI